MFHLSFSSSTHALRVADSERSPGIAVISRFRRRGPRSAASLAKRLNRSCFPGFVVFPVGFSTRLRPPSVQDGFSTCLRPPSVQSEFSTRLRPPSVQGGFSTCLRPPSVQDGSSIRLRPPSVQDEFSTRLRPPSVEGESSTGLRPPSDRDSFSASFTSASCAPDDSPRWIFEKARSVETSSLSPCFSVLLSSSPSFGPTEFA